MNKVTPEYLESRIKSESYSVQEGSTTTVCRMVMANGYELVGVSGCADPANFNEQIGRENARKDAIRQAWPLEGYLLREKLYRNASLPAWCSASSVPATTKLACGDIALVDRATAEVLITVSARKGSGASAEKFLHSLALEMA